MGLMDISFVILTWNSEAYIEKCFNSLLSSLSAANYLFEIFIVDNGSRDGTIEILKAYQLKYPKKLHIIYLKENVGTTISRNMALKQVTGRYVVIMDSDVEVPDGIFETLIANVSESEDIGLVVPRITYPSGNLQKSTDKFPTVQHKLNRFFRLKTIETQEGASEAVGHKNVAVDYAISAFWLFKKTVLDKVGLLDEKYFYAPEDVDYCLMVWKCGYRVVYVPQVTVIHHTQELSRGFKFNKAKKEHIKGLMYLYGKHKFLFKAPTFEILSEECYEENL